MTAEALTRVRSFLIEIYDRNLTPRRKFIFPLSVIAPMGNRICRELIPKKIRTAKEPWYQIIPHPSKRSAMDRSRLPEGPTSLRGKRYYPEQEPPPRVRLHPEAGVTQFTFSIRDLYEVLYRGVYLTDDFFLSWAEYLTRTWIQKGKLTMDDRPFYYSVTIGTRHIRTVPEELFPPEAFQMEGIFRLPLLSKNRKRYQFRKIVPAPYPVRDPVDYTDARQTGRGEEPRNRVFMRGQVYELLIRKIDLSGQIEMGGFLVGDVFRQPGSPENEDDPEFRWLVEITDLVPAERAWGKPLALLFTGDTWSRIRKHIDIHFKGKELVSWFHTHLFKASDDFGLSGWDLDLHQRFMTRPWQVAVLVNIDAAGEREIRCFQRGEEGGLVECTFEVIG